MFFSECGVRNTVLVGSLDMLLCPLGTSGSRIIPLGPGSGPHRKIYSEQTQRGQICSALSKKMESAMKERLLSLFVSSVICKYNP